MSVELTRFQLASTALTVTLNEPPAVCALGVPVLPEAVPGAAVSPGSRICSLANAPALIVVDGLVLAVIEPFVMSVDGERRRAGRLRGDGERLRAGDERGVGGQRGVRVGRGDPDGVGRADDVPVGVDRVDGDVERAAGGLRGRRAGLAGGGAGRGGLARAAGSAASRTRRR